MIDFYIIFFAAKVNHTSLKDATKKIQPDES